MSRATIFPFVAFSFALFLAAPRPAAGQCLYWTSEFSDGPIGEVFEVSSFDDGTGRKLCVGGDFLRITSHVGGKHLAVFDGTSWGPLGGGTDAPVWEMLEWDHGTGNGLYAGGDFSIAGTTPAARLARFDGTTWSSVGLPPVTGPRTGVYALDVWEHAAVERLYAGGLLDAGSGNLWSFDGTSWAAVGAPGLNGPVFALEVFDDGGGPALYAAGEFTTAGGLPRKNVARWSGTSWSGLGSGTNDRIYALKAFDDGSGPALYAAGHFSVAGGVPGTRKVARWKSTGWSELAGGLNDTVYALAVHDDGSGPALYAGGFFGGVDRLHHVAKWNGSAWEPLGFGTNHWVFALTSFDDGTGGGADLYAGGFFLQAGFLRSVEVGKWVSCAGPIDAFCFGDGSLNRCPCDGQAQTGRGCLNSTGAGALLSASGSTTPDTIVLSVADLKPDALTIFLQSTAWNGFGVAVGDGLRCLSGTTLRLYVATAAGGAASAPGAGDPSITARSAALGDPIAPGSKRYYQTIYRDDPAYCPNGVQNNWSNGVRIVW